MTAVSSKSESTKDGLMSGSSSGAGPNSSPSTNSTPEAKSAEDLKIAFEAKPALDATAAETNVSKSADDTEEDGSTPEKSGPTEDDSSKSNSQNSKSQSSSKKYYCPTCNQGFTRKHNMISHELIHSQSKPHVCTVCNLTFRRIHDLKRHEKLHTGEKPFSCLQCGKSFARPDSLTRHQNSANACNGVYKFGDSTNESEASRPQRPALPPLGNLGKPEYVSRGAVPDLGGQWSQSGPQSHVYRRHHGPGYYTTTTTTTTTTRHMNNPDGSSEATGSSDGGHQDEHQRALQENGRKRLSATDTRIPQDIRSQQDPQLQHDPRFNDGRFRSDLRTPPVMDTSARSSERPYGPQQTASPSEQRFPVQRVPQALVPRPAHSSHGPVQSSHGSPQPNQFKPVVPPQQADFDRHVLYNQPRNTSMYQYPTQQEYISLSRYQDLMAYTESLEESLSKMNSRLQLLEDESADNKIEKERKRQVVDEKTRRKRKRPHEPKRPEPKRQLHSPAAPPAIPVNTTVINNGTLPANGATNSPNPGPRANPT